MKRRGQEQARYLRAATVGICTQEIRVFCPPGNPQPAWVAATLAKALATAFSSEISKLREVCEPALIVSLALPRTTLRRSASIAFWAMV